MLAASLVSAQKNALSKGYVVTIHNDTLPGFVVDRDWSVNPGEITFRESETAQARIFKASALKAFRTEKSYYQAKFVKIEKHAVQLLPEPAFEQDTFLLETLVSGPISLYYLKEKDDKMHFFLERDNVTEELVLRKMAVVANGTKFLSSLELYKDQLAAKLNDCPDIQGKIKSMRYTKNAMLNIVRSYYTCTGKAPGYAKQNLKVNAEFGVTVGASWNKLVFNSDIALFNPITKANFSAMGVPVGVSLELILPKNRQLWSVNLEALYNSFKPEDKGYDYNLAYLKFNAIVRRYLSTSEIKPFLNVGLSYNIATTAEGILYDGSSSPFNQLNKSGFGVLAGAGVRKGRFSAELRYERSTGISNVVTVQSYINSAYCLVTYRFLK